MTTAFNYDPLRNTAIALVKKFGKKVPCIILRTIEAAPADPNKPWRTGAGLVLEFPFIGVVSTLGFPRRSDPIMDQDQDVIAPGDLETTGEISNPTILCGSPMTTDRIDIGGQQYAILGVQDIKPDAKTIIFKLRTRAWPLLTSQPSTQF